MHAVHKNEITIVMCMVLLSAICGCIIHFVPNEQQVSLHDFTAHAQSTVIRFTKYVNDIVGKHLTTYSNVLLMANCTDTELVKRLQHAKLSMITDLSQHFEITSSDLRMNGIESDADYIQKTKKAIVIDTLRKVNQITTDYNTFQSTVSNILTGSTPDSEKVEMMRTFLIKNS